MNGRTRILLVDDNPQDRGLVARELRSAFDDIQIREAINQQQLDGLLDDGQFDLVVTDFALQWTDGLAVLKAVKLSRPDCPVIMCTATGSEEIAVQAMKSGLDDYVIKNVKHLVRLGAVVRTVLDHRETARRAQRLESRLTDLTTQMKIGVFRASADGRLIEFNHVFRQILGYASDDDLCNRSLGEFFLDEMDFERCWHRLQAHGRLQNCETRLRRADGRVIWASCRLVAVEEQDSVTVIDALLDDITDAKAAETTRRKNEAQLAHTARLLTMGEMVAGIAHEINQPLGAIANYCAGAIKILETTEFPGIDQLREATGKISEQTQRGAQILRKLRAFVGRRQYERTRSKLNSLLHDTTELVAFLFREAQVVVKWTEDESDPEVEVDRVQIQQVLVNLLGNACEAMEQTVPGQRCVTIGTLFQADHVEVSIADRGTGLPEAVDELFQPFFTNKPHGMGLGLAISSSIVRQHGGKLWARSNEQGGATFYFTLPLPGGQIRES